MRVSRWEWLSRFFPLHRPARKSRAPKPPQKDPPSRTWIILGHRFHAPTKSEARARAKAALGYKDRLPAGTVVVEERRRTTRRTLRRIPVSTQKG